MSGSGSHCSAPNRCRLCSLEAQAPCTSVKSEAVAAASRGSQALDTTSFPLSPLPSLSLSLSSVGGVRHARLRAVICVEGPALAVGP